MASEDEILVEGESRTNAKRFQGRTRTNRLVLIEANERWRGQLASRAVDGIDRLHLLRRAGAAAGDGVGFVKIHHVAIIASDYARSRDFYTRILGLEIIRETHRGERQST